MYKVIVGFADLNDPCEGHEGFPYSVGDIYPREGKEVSAERLAELASDKNRRGVPLIKEVKVKKAPAKKPAKKTE